MQSPELASEALRHAAQHNGDRPSPSPDRDRGRGRGWGGQYGVGRAHAYYSSSASLYKLRRFNTLILVVRIVSLCFSLAASIFMALNIHKFGNDTSSNKARWYDYGAFSSATILLLKGCCTANLTSISSFERTGSLDKSFEGTPNAVKNEKLNDGEIKTPNRVSALFSGTQEKCLACGNTVYPIEKVSVEGVGYHKACFKCMHGGCVISPSNYIAIEGRLYCKHHHAQLFKEKGNYSQLIKTPSVKEVSENSVHE